MPDQALGHTCQIDAMLHHLEGGWRGVDGLIRPSAIACDAAVAACARVGRLDEAMAVFEDMVRPKLTTVHALVIDPTILSSPEFYSLALDPQP